MANETTEFLKGRIQELEAEVRDREEDLARFRERLGEANTRLEAMIQRLHGELKVAQIIQKALVPTEIPNIPGFEFSSKFQPSTLSGGDYFDIFEHEDRLRFGVVVASASGHSMSALLLSVLLKLTGQMEARRGAEPHKVLKKVTQEILPEISEGASADIFYSMVDRRTFMLQWCALGEIFALIQTANDGELHLLKPSHPSVHKGFSENLKPESFLLNSKDRVVIATRGIVEVKNLEGEEFGIERLSQAFAKSPRQGIHDLRNHILYEVQRFGGGQEIPRDQTLVAFEVKDRVIKLAQSSKA